VFDAMICRHIDRPPPHAAPAAYYSGTGMAACNL